ncbi:type II toxin-antitoxin system HipA family toxin [Sphingomonas sanguinis]|uniref:Type II toxin-antitoxin system HipA family toxin n=1 Tax=Sphingomonas sanguinis TaxID=33051 RepID=A0A7Y7UQ35_9SPHN|nr:type II toxin-antitoxin system HipA family toxin [Sphingomonas sanguinis]NNG51593.1 type II toxin-antitoxin system HipA family toxin [Sphingomonas sanguinis]NNG52378.1 type II toxin-antitoxin system HipA family toxin [Sphingomonas sanguinis]NVP29805.1 type II toxin-antitoxin system HipA family toxin [Sphingomonas sanguinis]
MTRLAPGTPIAIGLRFDEHIDDHPVGRAVMANGRAMLEWSREVLASGTAVSPLRYPLEQGLVEARSRAFDGLHGFLADSLPDGWGVLLMKRRVERLGTRWETLDAIDRLALVGEEGRGALVFAPATTPPAEVPALDLDALAAQSQSILLGDDASLVDVLARLGGASGGARPKVHVGFDANGAVRVDEGENAPGFESWIVKFPALLDPVDIGPIEQAYAEMARAAGITMAQSRLLPARQGGGYFATRRFDRPGDGRRLHMLSLAGAVEAPPHMPSLNYDGFLRATLAITRDVRDVEEAFRRMVFNVLACNRDDHTRQHAFLMDHLGRWRLAPAYDLTYSVGPGGEHYLAVAGEGRRPTRSHVDRIGRMHGIADRRIGEIVDAVDGAVSNWPRFAADAGVGVSLAEITDRLREVRSMFGDG